MNTNKGMDIRKLVTMAILAALVIVLQLFATFIPIKPVSITLTLVPIVIGAALYGRRSGALLGFIFGVVVLICTMSGIGAGVFWVTKPVETTIIIMLKGTAAGYVAGVVYAALKGKSPTAAGVCAAIVCPVVNTGIFCVMTYFIFNDILKDAANGASVVYYILFGMVGVNFLIELAINAILSPAVVRIIDIRNKNR